MDGGLGADVVLHGVAVRDAAPLAGALTARARGPVVSSWRRFGSGFRRNGLARLRVRVELDCGGLRVATVEAAYGAVREPGTGTP